MTERVLITGATGFIGRHCLPALLERGYEVHAVGFNTPGGVLPGIQWHRANLLDVNQVSGLLHNLRPTHLMHFAWYATPGRYWTAVENLSWLQASLALAQAFAQNGGQRLVGAGTCAEYDWRFGYCSEAMTPLMPATLYGICKNALQNVLDVFAKQAGLSAAWGRIFFVYGPYERPQRLVPSVINSLIKGEVARCSHGQQFRDFLHVADVAEAFVTLLESDVNGPVNIASGHPIALKDMISEIAARLGRPDLIHWGVVPTAPDEPPLLMADTRRLMGEVGWGPQHDLDNGLTQTIEWWQARFKETIDGAAA